MPYWIYEKRDAEHYAVFTMNRPDRLNAFGRRMLAERSRKGPARFNVVAHLAHHRRQPPVAGLLREHPQTRRQGQAGLNHGGELAREHRDVA